LSSVFFYFIRPDNILSCHGRWAYGHVVTVHSLACFTNTVYTFFLYFMNVKFWHKKTHAQGKNYESVHKIVSVN